MRQTTDRQTQISKHVLCIMIRAEKGKSRCWTYLRKTSLTYSMYCDCVHIHNPTHMSTVTVSVSRASDGRCMQYTVYVPGIIIKYLSETYESCTKTYCIIRSPAAVEFCRVSVWKPTIANVVALCSLHACHCRRPGASDRQVAEGSQRPAGED